MNQNTQKKAAVIGSGFGGLASAIRLQASGFSTTIYEARDLPGGRAYVYKKEGFTFDGGPTVITAPHCIEELFEVAGKKMADYVELIPVAPFYRLLWEDGYTFDYVGDSDQMMEQIEKKNPSDVIGYKNFLKYTKKVFDKGYTELASEPFLNFKSMLKVAPHLAKLRADRSVYSTVSKYIEDEKLRQAFSFHSLLVGGNPFETSAIYTLIHYLEKNWGVLFPKGGTGALVQGLVQLFKDIGGKIHLSTPVKEIQIRKTENQTTHEVKTSRGSESFNLVVSNADIHHTYQKLYNTIPSAQKYAKKLERMNWSMSLFVLYFGTDRPYTDEVVHHTVLFGPRYKELLRDIFKGQTLADDFSLYLHAPTHTDPTLAPEGCGTFYVLSPVPHLGNAQIDWEKKAPEYANKILHYLERVMPDLRKHVVTKHWLTPTGFQNELQAFNGSAFSVAPNLKQSAWFRPHNKDSNIDGLYLVGAGTHPGAGLPGVINSAKATAKVIHEDFSMTENSAHLAPLNIQNQVST